MHKSPPSRTAREQRPSLGTLLVITSKDRYIGRREDVYTERVLTGIIT